MTLIDSAILRYRKHEGENDAKNTMGLADCADSNCVALCITRTSRKSTLRNASWYVQRRCGWLGLLLLVESGDANQLDLAPPLRTDALNTPIKSV